MSLNLGACYKDKLEIDKAIFHTSIAIKIDRNLKNSYLNQLKEFN